MDRLLYPIRIIMLFFLKRAFRKCQRDEIAEEFLELLLKLMGLTFVLNSELRKNIEGFNGGILFQSRDEEIKVLAIFKNDRLKSRELNPKEPPGMPPNATIEFKDAEGLMNFLLPKGGQRDILRSILNNEIIITGNWNYVYRFGYIATHLQLEAAKWLP